MQFKLDVWSFAFRPQIYLFIVHFALTYCSAVLRLKIILVAIMAFWLAALASAFIDGDGTLFFCRFILIHRNLGEWSLVCSPLTFVGFYIGAFIVLLGVRSDALGYWSKGWRVHLGAALMSVLLLVYVLVIPFFRAQEEVLGKFGNPGPAGLLYAFLLFCSVYWLTFYMRNKPKLIDPSNR